MPLDCLCLSTTAGVFAGSGGVFFSPCFGYERPKRTPIENDQKGGKAKALEILLTVKKDSLKRKQAYEHKLANLDQAISERSYSVLDTPRCMADVAEKETSRNEQCSTDCSSAFAEDSRGELALEGDIESRTRELEEQAEQLLRENLLLKDQTQEFQHEANSKDAAIEELRQQVQSMTSDKIRLEERIQELESQNTDTPKPEKPDDSPSQAEETEELRGYTRKVFSKVTQSARELLDHAETVVATKASLQKADEASMVNDAAKPTVRMITRPAASGQSSVRRLVTPNGVTTPRGRSLYRENHPSATVS